MGNHFLSSVGVKFLISGEREGERKEGVEGGSAGGGGGGD